MDNDARRRHLRAARERMGFSHREMAQAIGHKHPTYFKWEKGYCKVPDDVIARVDSLHRDPERPSLRSLIAAWPGDSVPKSVLLAWLTAEGVQ